MARYNWKSANDFGLFQSFIESYAKELAASGKTAGIIYGGKVTPVAGLTVKVAKCLILFSTGQLVTADDQNVVLQAADVTHPRYDRLILTYSLLDDQQVTNIDNIQKILDRFHTGTASAVAGVAAGSPVVPAKPGGTVSAGVVHVAANQITIVDADIDQGAMSADFSRSLADLQFSSLVANAQGAAVNLPNLSFDPAQTKTARIFYRIDRNDNVTERVSTGDLWVRYRPVGGTWEIDDDSHGDEDGVEFSITAAGQVQYTSDNMAGGGYSGTMSYQIRYVG
ncbi:MAG: hypothetical protein ACXWPM_00085 [Bdellovibrionota bacterium]